MFNDMNSLLNIDFGNKWIMSDLQNVYEGGKEDNLHDGLFNHHLSQNYARPKYKDWSLVFMITFLREWQPNVLARPKNVQHSKIKLKFISKTIILGSSFIGILILMLVKTILKSTKYCNYKMHITCFLTKMSIKASDCRAFYL